MQMILDSKRIFTNIFGRRTGILLFIASVAAGYASLLNRIGISIDNPIAVICHDESEFRGIYNLMRNDCNEIIPLEMDSDDIRESIRIIQDNFIGFIARANSRANRGLALIEQFVNEGKMRKSVVMVGFMNSLTDRRTANYIVTEPTLAREYASYGHAISEWQDYLCKQVISYGPLMLNYLKTKEECYGEYGWLYAGALIINFIARATNETDDDSHTEILIDDISSIADYSEDLQDDYGVVNMAREYLFKFARESGVRMHCLTEPECFPIDIKTATYYDDTYYYIPHEVMKEAMTPLSETVKMNQILGALTRDGILITSTDGVKTKFTRKVPIIMANGIPNRFRFHMLKRDGIDRDFGSRLNEIFN